MPEYPLFDAETWNHLVRATSLLDDPPDARLPLIIRQHRGAFITVLCRQALLPQLQRLTNVRIGVSEQGKRKILCENVAQLYRFDLN